MDYLIKVKAAKYLGDYKIYCLFSNGEEKVVNLKDELNGEMFEPLKDKIEIVKSWIDKGDHDLGTAQITFMHIPNFRDTIAFHCQQ
ncbi:MAG: DUF2442 domain-containing protein [Bacteroidetes bacterium]|nr:DUF2442 domain-containing protein [Bacteroidota bacterium]